MTKRRRTPRRPGLDDQRYRDNRERLKIIGSHICHICRYPIDLQLPFPHPLSWSCDHVTPRSTLAPDDDRHWRLDALREAHFRCNTSRGAKPLPPIPGMPTKPEASIEW